MQANITGSNSTAIGNLALSASQTGFNTAVGASALAVNTTGQNVAVGYNAMAANTCGTNNTVVGSGALASNTTGILNTIIGHNAGSSYTGGERNNIAIGANVSGVTGDVNVIRIGLTSGSSACYIGGIFGLTVRPTGTAVLVSSSNQLGTISSSIRYKENVEEMGDDSSRLRDLRPVKFNYKTDPTKTLQYGLIAEEVEKIYPDLIVHNLAGEPETVQYHVLPSLLLNEIKKLQEIVENHQQRIEELENK